MSDAVEHPQRPPHQPLVPPGGMDLHAKDMTATFSADCPLRFVQWKLAELGQWLPVDGNPDATVGQLVETNSTGPLRLGFGAWRDLLLGAQFTNGKGELITAGGRTVKNVAGYDLTKFMVGNHGIFGRLVTVTARTYALPAGALLATYAPDSSRLQKLLPTPLRPQWAVLDRSTLSLGYLGDNTTLAWYEENLRPTGPTQLSRRTMQADIEHRTKLWHRNEGLTFRASVPPAKLQAFVAELTDLDWAADPAFGIVVGTTPQATRQESLRRLVQTLSGTIRFGSSPATLDVSTNPAERQIIERLKAAFDPDNRLQPLPWQRR